MKRELREAQLSQVLEECAALGVPDSIDLWPAIYRQLQARRRVGSSARLGWTSHRLVLLPVASVFLGVLLIATLTLTGREQGKPNSAAEVLNSLAKVAAAQSLPSASGGYRYMKSDEMLIYTIVSKDNPTATALVPKTQEYWVAPDGSGRIREITGNPLFFSERNRISWQTTVPPSLTLAINEDFGPGKLNYEDFALYPTDPRALADVIRKSAEASDPSFNAERFLVAGNMALKADGQPEFLPGDRTRIRRETTDPLFNVEMFFTVADLLRMPGAPPELRSALYRAAAKIEGVELVGRLTDRDGRQGVAISITTDYWRARQRFTLIFDPATSALLAEEKVLLEKADWIDADPPVVIGYATYLESGVVDRLP